MDQWKCDNVFPFSNIFSCFWQSKVKSAPRYFGRNKFVCLFFLQIISEFPTSARRYEAILQNWQVRKCALIQLNSRAIRFLNETNQAIQAVYTYVRFNLHEKYFYMRTRNTTGMKYRSRVLAGWRLPGSYYSLRESDTRRLYSKMAYEYDFGRLNVVPPPPPRNNS